MIKFAIINHNINTSAGLEAKIRLSGHDVFNFLPNSVEEAANVMKLERPDVIILDPLLTYIDGFEIVDRFKGDSELNNIPLFALVNSHDKYAIERLDILTADHCLHQDKLTIDELINKICKIIINYKYVS